MPPPLNSSRKLARPRIIFGGRFIDSSDADLWLRSMEQKGVRDIVSQVVDSMEFDCAKDMEIGIEKSNFGLDCSDTLAEGLKMGINRMISPLST
ncbi:hypothetical protein L2E82_10165 [Cichorium intybus]|uniref:Uncharacterized protein n=1 Tax=Cichorium intybus TaxID=13427 RepID=A0ACB9G9K9_CICIN|nr:hypothetical protein L2E82_10165 [Cichorium intybus]